MIVLKIFISNINLDEAVHKESQVSDYNNDKLNEEEINSDIESIISELNREDSVSEENSTKHVEISLQSSQENIKNKNN